MDDKDYARQINQMVQFIKQEAEEKANEIGVAAEEEFNILKLQMVETEKLKIRKEYERKDGQVEVKKKIEYSTQLNTARLKVLQARDDSVSNIRDECAKVLMTLTNNRQGYKSLLVDLIIQATNKLQAADVTVQCREADVAVCNEAIAEAKRSVKASVTMDNGRLPATGCGGVIVTTDQGRIQCSQALDDRLKATFESNTPLVRATLFGQS